MPLSIIITDVTPPTHHSLPVNQLESTSNTPALVSNNCSEVNAAVCTLSRYKRLSVMLPLCVVCVSTDVVERIAHRQLRHAHSVSQTHRHRQTERERERERQRVLHGARDNEYIVRVPAFIAMSITVPVCPRVCVRVRLCVCVCSTRVVSTVTSRQQLVLTSMTFTANSPNRPYHVSFSVAFRYMHSGALTFN